MKKLFVPLAILLVCIFILTGCNSASPSTPAPAATTAAATTPAASSPAATSPAPTTATKPAATQPAPSTPAATTAPGSKYGGILRWIEPQGPATPFGAPWESAGASVFTQQFCEQFLVKEMKGGAIQPNLAQSFDVVTDPENASITFHLRKGVKFHDGTDCNAQAIKAVYEKTKETGIVRSASMYWESFNVIDDWTLRVDLTTWYNRLTRGFADSVAFVVSPAALEKNGIEWLRWNMVGTGPFIQKEYRRDASLTATRNPDYWEQGKPYLDGVQLLYVVDELTRVALFKSGGAEVLNIGGNPRLAGEMEAAGFTIVTQPGGATVLVPDSANADSPWSNIKVRQAAEYALDKESMAKTFGYGYWIPAYQLNSPASLAHVPTLEPRKYDAAKAKQLLAEAGYPNGFKTRIIVASSGNMDIPQAIQSYFSKVGIQATLDVMESAKYNEVTSGTWNNAVVLNPLIEWANPNTGFNFFWGTPSSWFKSTGRPEGWAEAVNASNTTEVAEAGMTQKLETMAYDHSLVIPLYFGTSLWATTKNIHDHGIGTRGAGTWFEPQDTWLSK